MFCKKTSTQNSCFALAQCFFKPLLSKSMELDNLKVSKCVG
jgi:hypothetical protein